MKLISHAVGYGLLISAYPTFNCLSYRQGTLDSIVQSYPSELIIIACGVLLLACSVIGVWYPTPNYGGKPIPIWLKAPICIIGGFFAFLYCLYIDKSLTLLTPLWVGGISFVSPALIHLVHAALIKFVGMRIGLDDSFNQDKKEKENE